MVVRTPNISVPPLENGDRLTRNEFERRYHAMRGLKKAELIDGVVYMPSPVRVEHHGEPHSDLTGWLCFYKAFTPRTRTASDSTVRFDLDNEPQPDDCLFIDPAAGGQAAIDEDGYIAGPPELVGEVSASSASHDLHAKLNLYRRHGVREYIVWRVYENVIDWFVLRGSDYETLPTPADGILKSEVFPGLWLDAAAMLRGDMAAVLQALQRGLATSEHAAFVARLNP